MPKRQAVLLRNELDKLGLELLDVYSYKEGDFIRALNRQTGRVHVHKSTRKITALTSMDDIKELASSIAGRRSR
ncbi:MAG: hypothetical protein QXK88_04700 [Desulfurococcaceae archaeon]